MHITKVHVRKLVSGPGYNNHSVEAEAAVEAGDDAAVIVERLGLWVDDQIKRARNAGEMRETLQELIYAVREHERRKETLTAEIAELTARAKQLRLAINEVVPADDGLPF